MGAGRRTQDEAEDEGRGEKGKRRKGKKGKEGRREEAGTTSQRDRIKD